MNFAARTTAFLGSIFWSISLALSIWFWRERTLFCDTAFQTFLMLTEGGLQIMVERWVAAGVRVFPWLAIQFEASLKFILISYSISYVIFHAANFWWCWRLGQWQLALLQIFLCTLFVRNTFFWVSSELMLGLAVLISWWAWLRFSEKKQPNRWLNGFMLLGGAATIIYAHPLVIFPAMFGCLFFLFSDEKSSHFSTILEKKQMLMGMLGLLFFWIIKNLVLPLNWYDAMSQQRASKIWETFPDWFNLPIHRDFWGWCTTDYPLFLPSMGVVLGYYFLKKKWKKFFLTLSFSVVYLLLVHIPFSEGDRQFYLESFYHCLSIFVGIPLILDVLPFENRPKFTIAALLFSAALSIFQIILTSKTWRTRHEWLVQFLQKTAARSHEKIVLSENEVPMDTLQLSWGTSYEFLLISALHSPDATRNVLVDEDPMRFEPFLQNDSLFLGEFKNYSWQQLPTRYFKQAK